MNTASSRNLPDELLSLVATRFRLLGASTRLKLLEAGIVARRRAGGNAFYNVNGRVVYLLIDAVHSALDSQAKQRRDLLAAARPHEIADGKQR